MTDFVELRWAAFSFGDWLASPAVLLMLPEQEGAYFRLLAVAWGNGSVEPSLPADDRELAVLSRLGRRWTRLGPLIRSQFVETTPCSGRIHNLRQVDGWREQQANHKLALDRATKGGHATADKWRKLKELRGSPPDQPPDQPEGSKLGSSLGLSPAQAQAQAMPEALENSPEGGLEAMLEPRLKRARLEVEVRTTTTTNYNPPPETDVSGEDFGAPPEQRLAARLPDLADRAALAAVLRVAPSPAVWAHEMLASLDGMNGHVLLTPAQLSLALRDYLGNGASSRPGLKHFRAYLQSAAKFVEPSSAFPATLATDPVLAALDQLIAGGDAA